MRSAVLAPAALVLAAACGDANLLPDPFLNNVVDTVEVFAVSGTPVFRPSGYAMTSRSAVRLDVSTTADFAYDITSDGRHVFLPGRMIGQPGQSFDPGLQATTLAFDEIKVAVVNGYLTEDSVEVDVGRVFYLRSRVPTGCFFGVPAYGKLEVLSFDAANRSVTFQVLANLNCGYKGLEPGIPTQ